jgi:hypothetical protein
LQNNRWLIDSYWGQSAALGNDWGIHGAGSALCFSYVDGGASCSSESAGTRRNHTERVLHAFKYHPAAQPNPAVIFDGTGNLYGTAANDISVSGYGAVFKLAPKQGGGWSYTVLHTFLDKSASFPYGSLVLDNAGNLYGTASDCSNGNNCYGDGVIFQVSP